MSHRPRKPVGSAAGKLIAVGLALVVHALLVLGLGSTGVLRRFILPSSPSPAPAPMARPAPAPEGPAPKVPPPAPAPRQAPPPRPQRARASHDPGRPALFSYEDSAKAQQAPPTNAPRAAELRPSREVLERALSRPDGGSP